MFGLFGQSVTDSTEKGQTILDTSEVVVLDTSGVLFEDKIHFVTDLAVEATIDTIIVVDSALKAREAIGDTTMLTRYDLMSLRPSVLALLKDSAYWMSIDSFFVHFDSLN